MHTICCSPRQGSRPPKSIRACAVHWGLACLAWPVKTALSLLPLTRLRPMGRQHEAHRAKFDRSRQKPTEINTAPTTPYGQGGLDAALAWPACATVVYVCNMLTAE